MKVATLLFLINNDEILLAMKKRGFGAGKWNGVGGKVDAGETIEQALVRESQEEIGVTPQEFEKVAVHNFLYSGRTADMQVHACLCKKWRGEPVETEEMAPRWFKQSEIPYDDMWPDDIVWLPLVLRDKKLKTEFIFDGDNIKSIALTLVDKLP